MTIIIGRGPMTNGSGCVMQHVIWDFTNGQCVEDHHPCFNTTITCLAQIVNDGTPRPDISMRSFLPRLERCRAAADPGVEARVNRDLLVWLAERQGCFVGILKGEQQATLDPEEAMVADAVSRSDWSLVIGVMNNGSNGNWGDATTTLLDEAIDQWEKLAAEHGALGNPLEPA